MTGEERVEMIKWIERLKTLEGRESFKRTMKCDDKAVDYEIALAQNVLKEEYEYQDLVRQLNEQYGVR